MIEYRLYTVVLIKSFFIYIALYIIQIVSKQLYSDNRKLFNNADRVHFSCSAALKENIVIVQLKSLHC